MAIYCRKLPFILLVLVSFLLAAGSASARPVRITRKNISEFVKVNGALYCRFAQAKLGVLSSRRLRPGSVWRPIKLQRVIRDYSRQLRTYQKTGEAPGHRRVIKSLKKKISSLNEAKRRCAPPECSDGIDNDGDGLADWDWPARYNAPAINDYLRQGFSFR